MEHNPKTVLKKAIATLALVVMVSSAASVVFPHKAHAQFVDPMNLIQNTIQAVFSSGENLKDYVFDTLAWQVANLAIESITKSTVNWINSGFQGSPAFVTDLNQNLQGVGDAVAAQFFDELAMEFEARTPFQDPVLDSVRLGYYLSTSPESFYTRYPYTLNQVSANDQAFLRGDFNEGGFNAWFATVLNPQNNPYGARDLADQALREAVSGATNTRLQELSWNRGFLSWRGDCTQPAGEGLPDGEFPTDLSVDISGAEACAGYEIETPGSVIMEQLNTQLGSGVNRLVSADEFNEIIGALLNQLASQVLGGNSGGLRGVSRPTSGGGSSFLDQAGNSSGSSGAAISRSFSATIASQRQQIEAYRTNWEKIRTAATQAESFCGANGQPNAQTVLVRATVALTKAADAIAALDAIQRKITEANAQGGNQTLTFLGITEEYNALMNSDTLPKAEEIAEAQSGALDTGTAVPGSLFSQLSRQKIGSCNTSAS